VGVRGLRLRGQELEMERGRRRKEVKGERTEMLRDSEEEEREDMIKQRTVPYSTELIAVPSM
jgi:hypothetical protein